MRRASIERCRPVPASSGRGHSQARPMTPRTTLRTCRTGMGLTAPSRFLVRKSQKILGQKKQWNPAAIWSMTVKLVTVVVV